MKLTDLKGVGPKRLEALNKLDIYSVDDLIAFLPARYRDLTTVSQLCAVGIGTPALFRVRVVSAVSIRYPRRNFSIVSCDVEDISGRATAVWFNQPYLANSLKTSEDVYLYGPIEIKQGRRRLMNAAPEHEEDLCIAPVYRLPASVGITQRAMRQMMEQAVRESVQRELFTPEFRASHHLCERNFAVSNIHFPRDEQALLQARRRLCFEELLLVQLYIRSKRLVNQQTAGEVFALTKERLQEMENSLPFQLTNAQKRCLEEIRQDVTGGKAMNRLVQGDVGCGKTVIAFLAMAMAVQNGGQAAMMAPTDILARQHYRDLCEMFGEDNTVLLSGSLSAQERKAALARIEDGSAAYVVGTHALVQKSVSFHNLLLIITDEQHRFGVAQRAKFFAKGNTPHTLVMSATPIPRTLSLLVFGDLELSVIDELPKGRQKVSTSRIPRFREADMLQYIRRQLEEGRQAYFVCPLIEEDEENPAVSAQGLYEELSSGALAGLPVALLHGQMKDDEKKVVMDGFAKGEIKALVSTTVIEVGVNVRNATIMVIYGADRFGLAQLHQLRGRVGRGSEKSYCFLLTDTENPETLERLSVLTHTNDGFEIAQKDFDLRGPGDYMGRRQSGIAEARFSYALSNTQLLKETQEVLERDILPDAELTEMLSSFVVNKCDDENVIYN